MGRELVSSGRMSCCLSLVLRLFLKKNMNAFIGLLSIPQSGGGNVNTFRWDYRLQRQNLLFCFVFVSRFFSLSLKPRLFVQSFFVLRYACAPTATRSYHCLRPFSFFVSLVMSLFLSTFVPLPFSLINSMKRTSYVFSFRVVFFYPVTTG